MGCPHRLLRRPGRRLLSGPLPGGRSVRDSSTMRLLMATVSRRSKVYLSTCVILPCEMSEDGLGVTPRALTDHGYARPTLAAEDSGSSPAGAMDPAEGMIRLKTRGGTPMSAVRLWSFVRA
jgi:hypothetical protein